jgi:hypothetical protein
MNNEQRTTANCQLAPGNWQALYIRREHSTNQPIFLQNKPNFPHDQMAVSLVKTRNYNNEQRTMNYSKQSQYKATQSQFAGYSNEHNFC